MTSAEIQLLVARYSAGQLSDYERRTLFAAALNDQQLFDELVREQPLAEAFSQPAVRAQALELLQPRRNRWRAMWLVPAAAALTAVAFVMLRPHQQPVEVAAVHPAPAVEPRVETPAPKPVPRATPPAVKPAPEPPATMLRGAAAPQLASPPALSDRIENGALILETAEPAMVYLFKRIAGHRWKLITPGGIALRANIPVTAPRIAAGPCLAIVSRTPISALAQAGLELDAETAFQDPAIRIVPIGIP